MTYILLFDKDFGFGCGADFLVLLALSLILFLLGSYMFSKVEL